MPTDSKVTLLAGTVFFLVGSISFASSELSMQTPTTESNSSAVKFSFASQVTRATSLYDKKDGNRSDSLDFVAKPSVDSPVGSISGKLTYSQNLRDDGSGTLDGTENASDWGDASLTYLLPSRMTSDWKAPLTSTKSLLFTPSLTSVIPFSKNSSKRDELYTALITAMTVSLTDRSDDRSDTTTNNVAGSLTSGYSLSVTITAGRNFHAYTTNINGSVLNQYSSNQVLNAGYSIGIFSISAEFINKTRWTYQGNVKSAFEHTEEIDIEVNKNLSFLTGHTNAGSTLKVNGYESNVEFLNEDTSLVYFGFGFAF